MKIHDFAGKHKTSIRTLRYYVQINLLVPDKKEGQLKFGETCEHDFLLIEELKDSGFSIKEILSWMESERSSLLKPQEKLMAQQKLLLTVRARLSGEERRIHAGIQAAEEELLIFRKLPQHNRMGLHVDFLSFLCCPVCGGSFAYEHVRIADQELREGKVSCKCGYEASIKDGIFLSENQGEARIVSTDTNRETYGRLKPDGINMLQKNFNWLLKKLQSQPLKGKVVFENFVNTICFLSTGIQFLDLEAYYIVTDSDYQVVSDIKARIEALDIPAKILFIVNNDLNYPIRKHTVDIVLDYFHSEIIQSFGMASLEEALLPFVHPGSKVAGIYTYIKKGRKTLENNRKMFPNSYQGRFLLTAFKENMKRCGLAVLDEMDKNLLTYSVIEVYGEGDILGEYCFFMNYNAAE